MHTSRFGIYQLLSIKLCSMCVHRSAQDLEICCIISRTVPIAEAGGIIGRAVIGCPSKANRQVWYLSALLNNLCLLNFVPFLSIDPFKILKVYCIISRPVLISKAVGILLRAIVGCPSNAHLQVWYLSAPLHHRRLLNFVPCVSIDPFMI